MLILFGCLEMTDMVKALLQNSMPLVLEMVKAFLAVDLPDFILQIFVDSVMKALLAQLRIAHLMWHEVLSTSRPLTTAQVEEIKSFANNFPATNVGSSGTFMDLLFPFVYIFRGLHYEYDQLQQVLQDPSFCA